eukprot:GHVO01044516.1.p1 GENE.GHVO01044516.1~~GHVO01044516.1.p1  ORF type:complete len:268 (+),score=46.26 GHVO01044516.1:917-1720(+)
MHSGVNSKKKFEEKVRADAKHREECQKAAYRLQCLLIESHVDKHLLLAAQRLLRPSHLDDVAINRNDLGRCGLPVCEEKPAGGSLYIPMRRRLVVEDELIRCFCSVKCYDRFEEFRETLRDEVLHLRSGIEEIKQDVENARKSRGEGDVPFLLRVVGTKSQVSESANPKPSDGAAKLGAAKLEEILDMKEVSVEAKHTDIVERLNPSVVESPVDIDTYVIEGYSTMPSSGGVDSGALSKSAAIEEFEDSWRIMASALIPNAGDQRMY